MTDVTPARAIDDSSVRSVRRALAILRSFRPRETALALGEIARRADLDKATTRRLLRTLIGERLIQQDAQTKEYAPGIGLIELRARTTPLDELRRQAQPRLVALAAATGAAVFLLVQDNGAALCIEALEGEPPARAPYLVGQSVPLHTCAAARVLMAHARLDERMAMLAGPLAGGTDPFQLSTRLDMIRQRDWDAAVGEAMPGLAVLGLPVRRPGGAMLAALGIAAPRETLLDGDTPRALEALRARAAELERVLAAGGARRG